MNISQQFTSQGLIYDRFSNQSLSLPYDLNQIKIQPNDTVSNDLVNLKLQHLYDNFLFLYKNCKIASNYLPASSSAILGTVNVLGFTTWDRSLQTSQFFSLPGVTFADTKSFFAVKNTELPAYTMFCSNGIDLYAINSDINDSTISLVFSANTYNQQNTTNVNFVNIARITQGPGNTLLILDQGANALYQYDASGFLTNNTALNNKLVFLRFIGGSGSILDKLSFNNPADVVSYQNNIYVLDAGNRCIKQYDENLNWLKTYRLVEDFKSFNTTKLRADNNGNFYVLINDNKLIKYANNFQNKQIIDIKFLQDNEIIIDIIFSPSDQNIFYVITNYNVYKRFLSHFNYNIGKYLFYNFNYNNVQTISAFAAIPFLQGDKTLVVSKNGAVQIIGSFYDYLNLYDVLSIPDFDVYNLQDIQIKNEEYVQSWVINKSIAKMVLNHARLRDQIIGKFLFTRDGNGNIVFNFTRYLTPQELASISFNYDMSYDIGQNEVVTNAVMNRSLQNIYTIQTNLLQVLRDEQSKTLNSNTTVFLG